MDDGRLTAFVSAFQQQNERGGTVPSPPSVVSPSRRHFAGRTYGCRELAEPPCTSPRIQEIQLVMSPMSHGAGASKQRRAPHRCGSRRLAARNLRIAP
jgi:hypothetical protein